VEVASVSTGDNSDDLDPTDRVRQEVERLRAGHDAAVALEHLKKIYPDGPWVLTAIEVDGPALHRSSCADEEHVTAFLKRHSDRNIYYDLNKLSSDRVEAVHYFHVDLNPIPGEELTAELARIKKLTRTPPSEIPLPTACIHSGGGYQLLWALEVPIAVDGELSIAEDAKRYNLAIQRAYGAEDCHNVDRITRLAGTTNWPQQRKRARGQAPAQARLEWFEKDRRYPITLFKQAPIVQTQVGFGSVSGSRSPTVPRVSGNHPRLESIHDLPRNISAKTKVLIVQGRDPDDLISTDRTQVVDQVCRDLVQEGVDDSLIYSILTDPEFGISAQARAQGSGKERWALRMIERAKEFKRDPHLLELNERHAVVENFGGRCRVLEEQYDQVLRRSALTFQSFDDFRNRYMHRYVHCGTDKKGNPITTALGKWWLGEPARRQFQSIVFSPGRDIDGVYNLWRGFAVEPRPGDKHLKFIEHIYEDLCDGKQDLLDYLLNWMALAIQKPDAPGQVAVVLRGRKGTGKGFFTKTFGRLFGRHYLAVTNAKHLVGQFNSHLRDCVVLFGDEAFWAGDKAHESVLKALITEDTLMIEKKGVDVEPASNYVHLIMASNEQWVVPASYDERRFFVLDVSAAHMQDTEYFGSIEADLMAGGLANLLHALQTRDLSNFDVRTVPRTEALLDQKVHSMTSNEEWWFRKLSDGVLAPMHASWETPVPKDTMIDDYLTYAQRLGQGKRASGTGLTKFLERCVPKLHAFHAAHRGRDDNGDAVIGRALFWQFPPLNECRETFGKQCGGPFNWNEIEVREKAVPDARQVVPVEAQGKIPF